MKFCYFDGLYGQGEAVRIMANFYNIPLEVILIDFESFTAMKEKLPFGSFPSIEVNGKFYAESTALINYLGRCAGVYPCQNNEETMEFDSLQSFTRQLIDTFYNVFVPRLVYKHFFGKVPIYSEPFSAEEEKCFEGMIHPRFKKLNDMASKYDGQSMLGSKTMGFAELLVLFVVEAVNTPFAKTLELETKYPHLHSLCETLKNSPQLKQYFETRPVYSF